MISARNLDQVYVNNAATVNATESGSVHGILQVARINNIGTLVVNVTIGGTAVPGTDYVALPTAVTIPNGAYTANLSIVGLGNVAMLGSQSVSVDLVAGSGYNLGSPQVGAALILDDIGPTTSLTSDKSMVTVGDTVTISVLIADAPPFTAWGEMVGSSNGAVKLQSQVVGDFPIMVPDARPLSMIAASNEVHAGGYGAGSGSGRLGTFTYQVLAPGAITFTAPAQGAGVPFGLALIDSNGQKVIPLSAPPLTITAVPAPLVTITSSQPQASEVGPTPAYITVARNSSSGSLTINLLASGTSTASEWQSIPSVVTFAPGVSSVTMPITPVPDHAVTGTQTLVLTVADGVLYHPGAPSSVTLLRIDADGSNLSLVANTNRPLVNGQVTVTVQLTQAPAFGQYGCVVRFPHGALSLASQLPGTANFGSFVPDARSLAMINASGEVHLGGYAAGYTSDPKTDDAGGTGDLAVLVFSVLTAGTDTISTTDQADGDPFGDALMTMGGLTTRPNISGNLVLTAVVDHAPIGINLSSTHVRESRPVGTLVGILTAVDPDSGDFSTFQLVSGSGSADNFRFTISGNQLLTAQVLSATTTPTCSILVQATDTGGLSVQVPFIITVDSTGNIIYVLPSATGLGTGATWTDAFPDLAPALAAATAGKQVWVAAGTYLPTSGTSTTVSLPIASGVQVFGGFAGGETALSQRAWSVNHVTLSGLLSGGVHSRHVVALAPGGALDGVLVTQGDASSALSDQSGGGVLVGSGSGSALIQHCVIASNHAAASGGGIASSGGDVAILSSVLDGNAADAGAGALAVSAGSSQLTNVSVTNSEGFTAGGIDAEGSAQVAVINCVFDQDTSPSIRGGASAVVTVAGSCLPSGDMSGTIVLGGNVLADPQLLAVGAPAGLDAIWLTADDGVQLSPGSPCRGAGLAAGLSDDVLGTPIAAAVDIGAYQFVTNPNGTLPTITSGTEAGGTRARPSATPSPPTATRRSRSRRRRCRSGSS